jgi:hypothetical protein
MVSALLVVALLAGQGPAGKPPPQSLPPGYIQIDAAKNPELIPEHIVWSTGFHSIQLLKDNNVRLGETFFKNLTLSEADAVLLWAEVEQFAARTNRCQERGEKIVAAMQGQKMQELERAMKENTLQCRIAMLESKDRLLAKMTPEGQATLTMWMLDERSKLKSIVLKSDLDFFPQPR